MSETTLPDRPGRPRARRHLGWLVAAVLAVAVGLPATIALAALLSATTRNPGNTFSITSLYSPTGLGAARAGSTVTLTWTAPASFNGNGYAISGVDNGNSNACPTTAAAFTTFVAGAAASPFADSASALTTAPGPWICYLVQTAYKPGAAPNTWAAVPAWSSQDVVTRVAVQTQIGLVGAGGEATGGTNLTLSFPAPTAAGHLLVATVAGDNQQNFGGPAGWTRAGRAGNGSAGEVEIWYRANSAAGTANPRFTCGGCGAMWGQVSEWSLASAAPFDKAGTKSDGSGNNASTTVQTAAATSAPGDLAITVFGTGGSLTFTTGAGWTAMVSDGGNGFEADFRRALPVAVAQETESMDGPVPWAAVIATFKRS